MPRIFLTGFMGCGKSVVGSHLAVRLNWLLVDLDDAVEVLAGRSIDQIFADSGEEVFRDLEAAALRKVAERTVCALGGGTIMYRHNLEWMRTEGFLIYLDVTPEVLLQRLTEDCTVRPLLHDPNGLPLRGKPLKHRIEALLTKRETYYRRAHAIVPSSVVPPAEVAQRCAPSYFNRKVRR